MEINEVKKLSEKGAKELLEEIILKLDELDQDDFFGTEGWRKFLGFSDR
jgi:hypothetical protein